MLTTGTPTNATLSIVPPANIPSGTDVTLTLEARASDGEESNFVVLRFAVVAKVTALNPDTLNLISHTSSMVLVLLDRNPCSFLFSKLSL